ncbi:MAG: tRNA (adenosine(37)-N6)-threonylcarbamoyltransferase complex dimerization subunit type 1 TsaB [Myxococcota bacterium]
MNVLAVDTSTDASAVAVVRDGSLGAESAAVGRARHGEVLLARIEQALEAAGIALSQVDLLAVGIGPGSFTGLRVGLATVKGLALSQGLPVVGVPSLRVLALGLGAGGGRLVAPVVDAHHDEVFSAAYRVDGRGVAREVLPPFHALPEEVAGRLVQAAGGDGLVLCGGGARRHAARMEAVLGEAASVAPAVWDVPRASLLALEAAARHAQEGPSDLMGLEPLYVRPSDAKLPQSGGGGGASAGA